jgi:hypothetical protein
MRTRSPDDPDAPTGLSGTLSEASIRDGRVRKGDRFGLFQRRVRPSVFGEPPDDELVLAEVHPARPHRFAWEAWQELYSAGVLAGAQPEHLLIHSAYRSVALQAEIWQYRLDERRRLRAESHAPPISDRDLERLQRKWTAKPGQSAHHTGLALDLGLYLFAKREGLAKARRTAAYQFLAHYAREFGFYPYLPEPWHWEYNPPGLIARIAALRRRDG